MRKLVGFFFDYILPAIMALLVGLLCYSFVMMMATGGPFG